MSPLNPGFRAHPGKGMGVAAGNFDVGGKMDLFVPNDKLMNSFFRSRGGGLFRKSGFDANVALREDGSLHLWHGS